MGAGRREKDPVDEDAVENDDGDTFTERTEDGVRLLEIQRQEEGTCRPIRVPVEKLKTVQTICRVAHYFENRAEEERSGKELYMGLYARSQKALQELEARLQAARN